VRALTLLIGDWKVIQFVKKSNTSNAQRFYLNGSFGGPGLSLNGLWKARPVKLKPKEE